MFARFVQIMHAVNCITTYLLFVVLFEPLLRRLPELPLRIDTTRPLCVGTCRLDSSAEPRKVGFTAVILKVAFNGVLDDVLASGLASSLINVVVNFARGLAADSCRDELGIDGSTMTLIVLSADSMDLYNVKQWSNCGY